jgi:hypothetical protein
MLKSIIICAICLAAAGMVVWTKAVHPPGAPIPAGDMQSIQELHTKAHLEGLPIQEIKDPS